MNRIIDGITLIKIKRTFIFYLFRCTDNLTKIFINSRSYSISDEKRLLILRVDGIGDYILFRNFIEVLKSSEKYKNYEIHFLGNRILSDFAESFDNKFIDQFFWIDYRKYRSNIFYRTKINYRISQIKYDTVLVPNISREYRVSDSLVYFINAENKVGIKNDHSNLYVDMESEKSEKMYSRILKINNSDEKFEFENNNEIISQFLNTNIQLEKPELILNDGQKKEFTEKKKPKSPYFVLFPGANEIKRRWSALNFAELADLVLQNYSVDIILSGSIFDSKIASEIIGFSAYPDRIIDFTGQTPLNDLAFLINSAECLVSNETGAIHLAVALNKKVVCISNGNHYSRFNPYPEHIFSDIKYAYHPEILRLQSTNSDEIKNYRKNSDLNIDEITPSYVYEQITSLINNWKHGV